MTTNKFYISPIEVSGDRRLFLAPTLISPGKIGLIMKLAKIGAAITLVALILYFFPII